MHWVGNLLAGGDVGDRVPRSGGDSRLILDVSRRGLDRRRVSIALGEQVCHRAFGEVAAVAGLPFVVHVGERGADESDHRGFAGDAFRPAREQLPAAETWLPISLKDLGIGAQVETWPSLRGRDGRISARGQSSGA